MAVAVATLPATPALAEAPIIPADLLAGWEPTQAGPEHHDAVLAVAESLGRQLIVANDISSDDVSLERWIRYSALSEREQTVEDHGADLGGRIFTDALALYVRLLGQVPTAA